MPTKKRSKSLIKKNKSNPAQEAPKKTDFKINLENELAVSGNNDEWYKLQDRRIERENAFKDAITTVKHGIISNIDWEEHRWRKRATGKLS